MVGGNKDGRGGTELAGYYEWGGLNSDSTNGWSANRPGWYKPIKELLEENRVTIFFHGHDHFFAKQKLGCLIYQECPQPSLPNFQTPQNAANYGYVHGTIIPNSGHLRVNVSPAGVSVDYIRAVLPSKVTPLLHNKDTSYTYSIGAVNCYDSLTNVKNPKIGNINLESDIFPNPFSLMTSIKYSISKANNVEVKVYDILGKEIATIINQYQSPGNHIIDLTPENYNLKNGIYYCRIITGNYSVVKKMICLK